MLEHFHNAPSKKAHGQESMTETELSTVPSRDAFHTRIDEIQAIEQAERDHDKGEMEMIDSELTTISAVDQIAKENGYFGHPDQADLVESLFLQELANYCQGGLPASDVLGSPERVQRIGELVSQLLESGRNDSTTEIADLEISTNDEFKARLLELQASLSPFDLLTTLRSEFATRLDEEILAKIDRFSQLLSPQVVSNEQDRAVIETLFTQTVGATVTEASFSDFVYDIYAQPDSVVSEEAKTQIEAHFQIPRNPIATGRDLANETMRTSEDGNPVHDSPDTALEFRPGVKTYVDGQDDAKLVIGNNSRTEPLAISPEALANSEQVSKLANYSLIRKMIYQELSQTVNVFGGGLEDELGMPSQRTLRRAYRFAHLLLPRRTPDKIFSGEELGMLRSAFRTFKPMGTQSEVESINALADLGLVSEGTVDWSQTKRIGRILRENRYFRSFENRKPGLAHEKLKAAINTSTSNKPVISHESQRSMSTTEKSGHSSKVALEWIFSRRKGLESQTHTRLREGLARFPRGGRGDLRERDLVL